MKPIIAYISNDTTISTLPEQENLSTELPIEEGQAIVAVRLNDKTYALGTEFVKDPTKNAILVTELARRLVRTVQILESK